jgi:mannosyltransferase OCH1-like enzyme
MKQIPKIIHQIWFQGDIIPEHYPNYRHTWKELNPSYKFILWNNKMIDVLLNKYPQYRNKYESLPLMIQKIDYAKYIILYHYGGIYIDVDCECLKPIDDLLKDKECIVAKFNVQILAKIFLYKTSGDTYQNGFMASIQNHDLWTTILDQIQTMDIKKLFYESRLSYVFRTTGPVLLTNILKKYKGNITKLDKNIIDPIEWCDLDNICWKSKNDCIKQNPSSYTLHHYGSRAQNNNWSNNIEKTLGLTYCKHKIKINITMLLIIVIGFGILSYYKGDVLTNIINKYTNLSHNIIRAILYNIIPAFLFAPYLIKKGIKYDDIILIIMGICLMIVDTAHAVGNLIKPMQ